MSVQREVISREEAKRRAAIIARVVPGATVRSHASGITVITRGGKHIACWLGRKDGFHKAEWAR